MRFFLSAFFLISVFSAINAEHPVIAEKRELQKLETLLKNKKFTEAATKGEELAKTYPANTRALYLYSIALIYQSYESNAAARTAYAKARLNLKQCEKLFSTTPTARRELKSTLFYIGFTYQMEENFDMAIAHYRELIKIDGAEDEAWYNMATCYERKNDIVEANRALLGYKRALELQAEDF